MAGEASVESRIAVLTNWGFLGAFGVGFVLSGFRSDSYLLGLLGFALLAAAFVAHLIINRIYAIEFAEGEIAAAFAIFGLALLGFVASWLFTPNFDRTQVELGLTGSALAVVGCFAYVVTRHGLKGSFSMFHIKRPAP
jgi:DMSO/TMAO reductase YedYZ heme-binding membrane subunit